MPVTASEATRRRFGFPKLRDTLLVLGLLFVTSCSGARPEILFTDWDLIVGRDPESASPTEHLRFYVAVSDADGVEDVERVLLIHEESELYWELTPENWVGVEHGGDQWFGAPEIRVPGAAAEMPRGRYRVEVYDAALGLAEDSFVLNLPSPEESEIESLELLLEPSPELLSPGGAVIRAYSATGDVILQEPVPAGLLDESLLERLRGEPGSSFYLERALPSGSLLVVGPFASSSLPRE
jgi:hypothetical protein